VPSCPKSMVVPVVSTLQAIWYMKPFPETYQSPLAWGQISEPLGVMGRDLAIKEVSTVGRADTLAMKATTMVLAKNCMFKMKESESETEVCCLDVFGVS